MRLTPLLRRIFRRARRDQDGTALVELAIALPFMILVAIGVTEFGRVYFNAIRIANATMAGAEYGARTTGTADSVAIRQVVQDDAADQTLAVTTVTSCRCPGSNVFVACSSTCVGYGPPQFFVAVTTTKTHTFLLHYPGIPQSITVTRTATFREQ